MQIETLNKRLDKLSQIDSDFNFELRDKLSKHDIEKTENRLGLKFPEKLSEFYENANGLITRNPSFKVLHIDTLKIENDLIHFSTFDETIKVCFKVDKLNVANEWTIIEKETGFEITKTISSFWSNKIWHWIEKNHKIWVDNWWE